MELVEHSNFYKGLGESVKIIIKILINDKNDGIMIPVPRFP